MMDLVIILIIVAVVGAAVMYIRKAKRRGVKCIGCPSAGECANKHNCSSENGCSCGCHTDKNKH